MALFSLEEAVHFVEGREHFVHVQFRWRRRVLECVEVSIVLDA
tara:strand:- start:219 stop:347 length:129 start_codon:yes stop_codon:yes gene_type:complete